MKTYLADIIPKIKKLSEKLDNVTLLTNKHWVVIDENSDSKYVYIFRDNNELLIAENGRVKRAKWEYLDKNTLLVDCKDECYLFRHGFFDANILALKIDGKQEYAFLVNEIKFNEELNSYNNVIEFLGNTYLQSPLSRSLPTESMNDSQNIQKYDFENNSTQVDDSPKFIITETLEQIAYGDRTKKHLVLYFDSQKGDVFEILKNNRAFFKGKENSTYHYKNVSFCINALYLFLTQNEISKIGFITKYG